MSKQTEVELRDHVCDANGCWHTRVLSEAGVTADLRGNWRILQLDQHFSKCVPPKKRCGGLCDGVAVLPNTTNNKLKLLELKQDVTKLPAAKPQLIKGAELVQSRLPSGFERLDIAAELHVRTAPRSTTKLQKTIIVGKLKVPVRAFRNGEQV